MMPDWLRLADRDAQGTLPPEIAQAYYRVGRAGRVPQGIIAPVLQQAIATEARRQNVDPALALAVAEQESSFNPFAVGDHGASLGLFQLQRDAATDVGVDPDQRHATHLNIRGGIQYLAQKLHQAGGNRNQALALYNGGGDPQYVRNVLQRYPHHNRFARRPPTLLQQVASLWTPASAEAAEQEEFPWMPSTPLPSSVPAGGYLGPQHRTDGQGFSSVLQIGVQDQRLNSGRETNIPLLVPGQKNVQRLVDSGGKNATREQIEIAIRHAQQRLAQGEQIPSYDTIEEATRVAETESQTRGHLGHHAPSPYAGFLLRPQTGPFRLRMEPFTRTDPKTDEILGYTTLPVQVPGVPGREALGALDARGSYANPVTPEQKQHATEYWQSMWNQGGVRWPEAATLREAEHLGNLLTLQEDALLKAGIDRPVQQVFDDLSPEQQRQYEQYHGVLWKPLTLTPPRPIIEIQKRTGEDIQQRVLDNLGIGVRQGTAAALHTLSNIPYLANRLRAIVARQTGIPQGEAVTTWLERGLLDLEETVRVRPEVLLNHDAFLDHFVQAVATAGPGLVEATAAIAAGGPVFGLAALGGLSVADHGVWASASEAARYALLGTLLRRARTLPLAIRVPLVSAAFGLDTFRQTRSLEEAFIQALIGAGLAIPGEKPSDPILDPLRRLDTIYRVTPPGSPPPTAGSPPPHPGPRRPPGHPRLPVPELPPRQGTPSPAAMTWEEFFRPTPTPDTPRPAPPANSVDMFLAAIEAFENGGRPVDVAGRLERDFGVPHEYAGRLAMESWHAWTPVAGHPPGGPAPTAQPAPTTAPVTTIDHPPMPEVVVSGGGVPVADVSPEPVPPRPAPATFLGWQEGRAGEAPSALWNLTEDIPGHPAGSIVATATLRNAGYEAQDPEAPQPSAAERQPESPQTEPVTEPVTEQAPGLRLTPTDITAVGQALRGWGFRQREVQPILAQIATEPLADIEAGIRRGLQLLAPGEAQTPVIPRTEPSPAPAKQTVPQGEVRRVEAAPYNFVLYGDGEIRISSGGRFIEDPSPQLMEEARQRLGIAAPTVPSPRVGLAAVSPHDLTIDPERFQYKIIHGEKGTTGSLADVGTYDPQLAGVVQVWHDPLDDKTYVVNGHNRIELAKRANAPTVNVQYIDAPDAVAARGIGALTNIAQGQGTVTDAATFFRDTGWTAADLRAQGLSMRPTVSNEGIALAQLNPTLFGAVARGEFPVAYGVIIGQKLPDTSQQYALMRLLDKARTSGKRMTDAIVTELADMVSTAPMHEETALTLFGPDTTQTVPALEKAELTAYLRDRLVHDKNLFGRVGRHATAQELSRAGNVIDVEASQAIAQQAQQLLGVFDRLKNMAGPVNDAVNAAVERIAGGGNAQRIRDQLYAQLVADLPTLIRGGETPRGDPGPGIFGATPGATSEPGTGGSGERVGAATESQQPSAQGLPPSASVEEPAAPYGVEAPPAEYGEPLLAPTFVSRVRQVLEQRMPAKATAQQIRGLLDPTKTGVKAEEMKWLGLNAWLTEQQGPVTKQQVLNFLDAHQVRVETVVLGAAQPVEWEQPYGADFWSPTTIPGYSIERLANNRYVLHAPGGTREGFDTLTAAQRQAEEYIENARDNILPPRHVFGSLILPGATPWSHREVVFTLPPGSPGTPEEPYTTDRMHYGDYQNTVAWLRGNSRLDTQWRRIFFVEEVQSQWQQKVRKFGVRVSPGERAAAEERANTEARTVGRLFAEEGLKNPFFFTEGRKAKYQHPNRGFYSVLMDINTTLEDFPLSPELREGLERYHEAQRAANTAIRAFYSGGGPAAPFVTTGEWYQLPLKWALRYASENGYDGISWTTGAQQAERYNLRHVADALEFVPNPHLGDTLGALYAYNNGQEVDSRDIDSEQQLAEMIGQENAQRLLAQPLEMPYHGPQEMMRGEELPRQRLTGEQFAYGGKWAERLYDQMIPQWLNRYGKQWGARAEATEIPTRTPPSSYERFAIVDTDTGNILDTAQSAYIAHDLQQQWEARGRHTQLEDHGETAQITEAVHYFPITDTMRASVLTEGQSLFEKGVPYAVRPGVEPADAYRRAAEVLDTLDAAGHDPVSSLRRGGRVAGPGTPGAAGTRVLYRLLPSDTYLDDLRTTSRAAFVGHAAPTVHDIARLGYATRDPRIEYFDVLAMRGDRIVDVRVVSSRLPGSSQAFLTPRGPGRDSLTRQFYSLRRWLQSVEADGYYLKHNHPSTNTMPSGADRQLTRDFASTGDAARTLRGVPGFRGHVVINHNQYSVIDAQGNFQMFARDEHDAVPDPFMPTPATMRITRPQDVVRHATTMHTGTEYVTAFFRDNQAMVRAVHLVPERLITETTPLPGQPETGFQAWLRGQQRMNGASDVVLYHPAPSQALQTAARYWHAGKVIFEFATPTHSLHAEWALMGYPRPIPIPQRARAGGYRIEEARPEPRRRRAGAE